MVDRYAIKTDAFHLPFDISLELIRKFNMTPHQLTTLLAITPLLLLSACGGSMPNVKAGYYLPKSELNLTITQTAACAKSNIPIITTNVTLNPSYSSDTTTSYTLDLSEIDGNFTKADATMEFYPDGRLKSINTTQTGTGSEILTAALALAAKLSADEDPSQTPNKKEITTACIALKSLVKDEKPLTIIYKGHTDFKTKTSHTTIKLKRMSVSDFTFKKIKPIFGELTATYSIPATPPTPIHTLGNHEGQTIKLKESALAEIIIKNTHMAYNSSEYKGQVRVPQHGKLFHLPVQKAPFFGKNTFELALDESGHVSKLTYSGENGTASLFDSLSGVATQAKGNKVQDEAARIQAEADLIAQQQRLIKCQADPSTCE